MKKTLLFALLLLSFHLSAQTTVDFEDFGLSPGESINDASPDGGFSSGNIFLPNSYDPEFFFWSGWAISATTDVTTPGFLNDLSANTGGGHNGSATYAVSYAAFGSTMRLTGPAMGGQVAGMYVTNGTYATLSMKDGDSFAKKFGGETGDDPDFFLLTVKGYEGGELKDQSVDFYLADYRFEDNSQDYIVEDWTWLDLTSLGNVDSLSFELTSSDVGQFGMNTPAYFCVDDVLTTDMPTGVRGLVPSDAFSVFPNPLVENLNIKWEREANAEMVLRTVTGQTVLSSPLVFGNNTFEMGHLPDGEYLVEIHSEGKTAGSLVLKK